MDVFINVAILVACIVGLWYGAVWVVDSASRIAKRLGLSDLVVGLTVVAFATSAPEFAVTISAALKGQSAISVSNVVGSDIFNLGFILSIVALFSVVKLSKTIVYRDALFLVFTGLLLLFFFSDLTLTRVEGIIMVLLLVGYTLTLIFKKEKSDEEVPKGKFQWYDIPKLIVGAGVIIGSAHFFVDASSEIARMFGVSEWVIGVTIVAAGTSAPELATSIVALIKGNHGISVGNLIGSDLFNLLGVLGVASTIKSLQIQQSEYTSLILMAVFLIILFGMMRFNWNISKKKGIILMLLALSRWAIDIYLQ